MFWRKLGDLLLWRESLLLDGLPCCLGFVLSLLAGKGDLKWDSAAPEVNFS